MSDGRPCPFCNGTGVYHDLAPPPTRPRELRWTLATDRATGSHVTLVGEITEAANLDGLAQLPAPIVLDLSSVRYVNTMGSNSLVRLVDRFGGAVIGERCSPAIVRQLNLMPALSDGLKVASALVPYECPTCQVDHEIAVTTGSRRPSPPVCRCGTCGTELVPDEPFERYFSFLPPA